jgi:hypothetical protein
MPAMLPMVSLLLPVVAALAQGREVPVRPRIVPPAGEWFDARRIAAIVDEVRPAVERQSGLRFVRDPLVQVADHQTWYALVQQEMPLAADMDLAADVTFALYLADLDAVVLGEYVAINLLCRDTDEHNRERAAWARTMLAHELTHVLQDQHFALAARMRAETRAPQKAVLRALLEGFATVVEERAAVNEFGLRDYPATNTARLTKNRRLEYVRGRDYLLRLAAAQGEAAVFAAMGERPPTPLEFARVAARKAAAPPADGDTTAPPRGAGEGSVTLRVRADAGMPLGSLDVFLVANDGALLQRTMWTPDDDGGSWTWAGVAPGHCRIEVRAADASEPLAAVGEVAVDAGRAAADPRLVVDLRGHLFRFGLRFDAAAVQALLIEQPGREPAWAAHPVPELSGHRHVDAPELAFVLSRPRLHAWLQGPLPAELDLPAGEHDVTCGSASLGMRVQGLPDDARCRLECYLLAPADARPARYWQDGEVVEEKQPKAIDRLRTVQDLAGRRSQHRRGSPEAGGLWELDRLGRYGFVLFVSGADGKDRPLFDVTPPAMDIANQGLHELAVTVDAAAVDALRAAK